MIVDCLFVSIYVDNYITVICHAGKLAKCLHTNLGSNPATQHIKASVGWDLWDFTRELIILTAAAYILIVKYLQTGFCPEI